MWQRHRLSLLLLFPIQEESCNAPNQFLLTTRLVPTPPESSAGQSLLFPIHEQSLTADGQWPKFASSWLRRLVVDWRATNRWYSTSTQKVIKSGISRLRVAKPPPRWALLELCVHCTVCIALCTKCWFPLHSCALSGYAVMTVQKVTKILHPTSMKFIIFMFQIIRYSLKWIPNDKIFPKQNIWAAGRCNVGSFVCWLTSHQLKVKREAQISGLNFKLCNNTDLKSSSKSYIEAWTMV